MMFFEQLRTLWGRLSPNQRMLFGSVGAGFVLLLIGVMVWALLGATCLFMGLIIIQATLAFWTTETLELMNILTYGGIETAQFPMTIYLPWFRRFFTFVVPLACVNYFPVLLILEKPDPLGTTAFFQYISPATGILFLLVGIVFWNIGLRYYSSTGS